MRYLLKQKVFSLGDNFRIKDENERDVYVVKGKVMSLGDKLKLEDMNGNELYYIEQKLLAFLPEYNIYKDDEHVARVKKELTFFKPKFHIESNYGEYEMEGNIFAHEFEIVKNNVAVARVSKKYVSFSDSYVVDTVDDEDQAFLLSLVIVIDQVTHDNDNHN